MINNNPHHYIPGDDSMKREELLASLTDPVFDGPKITDCGDGGVLWEAQKQWDENRVPPPGRTGPGPGPTIALVTMTKNGIKRLPSLFESVLGFATRAVILDTGSTDGTQQWLREQKFLPVELNEYPFVNFEQNRNMLFAFAEGAADWLLLLDDDMPLNFEKTQKEVLMALDRKNDAYLMRHLDPQQYLVTRLVKGHKHWEYKGVTHEYLVGGGVWLPHLEGVGVTHNFHHTPGKFERDLKLLTADLARDPDDVRTVFYIANTLRDMGKTLAAIRFYCMRANMGGWDEEVFMAKYEAARLAEDAMAMEKVFESRPSRAEPAAWLTLYYAKEGNQSGAEYWEEVRAKIPFPDKDALFVNTVAYGPIMKLTNI